MSGRVTLVLAVAFFAVALYAWFDLREEGLPVPTPATHAPAEEPSVPLVEFEPDAVEAIHVERDPLHLQTRRDDGGWTGVQIPERVDDFLVTLRDMVRLMTVPASPHDLADFGLEKPWASIELQLRNGPPIRLFLGNLNPAGTANYVRVGRNGPVVLTGALLRWELEKLIRALTGPGGGTAAPTPGP